MTNERVKGVLRRFNPETGVLCQKQIKVAEIKPGKAREAQETKEGNEE